MRTERFRFTGHNHTDLPALLWQPEGETRALLQITHGMTEHIGRYEAFAEEMTALGIAVAGFDLRGHGTNPGDRAVASFGEKGWEAALKDMKCFYGLLEERFPGIPHYLHGFSLGSFLLREYLGRYPEDGAGAVILGTGNQPGWVLSVMLAIVKAQIQKVGFDGYSPLVRQLSFGTYNRKFKPNRTEKDWLCSDRETLDAFIADPLCRENFSAGLFWQMLSAMKRTGGKKCLCCLGQGKTGSADLRGRGSGGEYGKGRQSRGKCHGAGRCGCDIPSAARFPSHDSGGKGLRGCG